MLRGVLVLSLRCQRRPPRYPSGQNQNSSYVAARTRSVPVLGPQTRGIRDQHKILGIRDLTANSRKWLQWLPGAREMEGGRPSVGANKNIEDTRSSSEVVCARQALPAWMYPWEFTMIQTPKVVYILYEFTRFGGSRAMDREHPDRTYLDGRSAAGISATLS